MQMMAEDIAERSLDYTANCMGAHLVARDEGISYSSHIAVEPYRKEVGCQDESGPPRSGVSRNANGNKKMRGRGGKAGMRQDEIPHPLNNSRRKHSSKLCKRTQVNYTERTTRIAKES